MTDGPNLCWTLTPGLFELIEENTTRLMCTDDPAMEVVGQLTTDPNRLHPLSEDDHKWCMSKGYPVKFNPYIRLHTDNIGGEVFQIKLCILDHNTSGVGYHLFQVHYDTWPSPILLRKKDGVFYAEGVLSEGLESKLISKVTMIDRLSDDDVTWCNERHIEVDDEENTTPVERFSHGTVSLYTAPDGALLCKTERVPFTVQQVVEVKEDRTRVLTYTEKEWCSGNGIRVDDQCTGKDSQGNRCLNTMVIPTLCQGCMDALHLDEETRDMTLMGFEESLPETIVV